jgi:hypothetical protein
VRKLVLLVMLAGCGDDVMQVAVDANVGAPALIAMQTSLDFGEVGAGDPASPKMKVTVINTGGATSGELRTQVASTDAAKFKIVDDGCNTGRIAALGTCEVSVQFRPQLPDGAAHANLLIGAIPGGDITVALSGTAVPDPRARLMASNGAAAFGDEAIATTSNQFVFTISNPGTSATGGITVHTTGANPTAFGVITSCSAPLPAQGTCTAAVAFRPTAGVDYSASVELTASPGGGIVLALTGAGVDVALATSMPTIDFGPIALNTTAGPLMYTVTNTGSHTSSGLNTNKSGPDANDFVLDLNGCPGNPLNAGDSCTIGVYFTPQTPGTHTATITTIARRPRWAGSGTCPVRAAAWPGRRRSCRSTRAARSCRRAASTPRAG